MLNVSGATRVLVATSPVDLRGSFNRLYGLVVEQLKDDPLSGHLFVFRGRRGDRVKVLYWDRDGYALWYKRLEKGVFRFPAHGSDAVEVSAADLGLILEGIDLRSVKRQKRFALATHG